MESFEKWLKKNETNLCDDAVGLFMDAIRCYKNNINRPAYLLAYQGMLLTLRNKILAGEMPFGFVEIEWQRICKDISNDGTWDEKTFDRVVQQAKADGSKSAILNMPEEIREQFNYWRRLRNVCAHYKEFDFKPAHVLTLFAFISSYLLRISVEGGASSLLTEFEDYCNPAKYSQSTPLTPLLEKISDMVSDSDMEEFVGKIMHCVAKSYNRDYNEFLKSLIFLDGEGNKRVRECTLNIIKSDIDKRNRFIEANPDLVSHILTTPVEVREYWKRYLIYSQYPQKIIASLIENGLIPENELDELFGVVLENGYEHDGYPRELTDKEIETLNKSGYFECFFKSYFTERHIKHNYSPINFKTNFYIEHLFRTNITPTMVSMMVELLSELPYPYTLQKRIKEELWSKEEFKKTFEMVAHDNGISIPESFLS